VFKETGDVDIGSYGLDKCVDYVEQALTKGGGLPKPEGDDWAEGRGLAMAAQEGGPPTEHRSGGEMKLLPDGTYHLAIGSTEMGNGSVTSHRQIAAEIMGSRADQIDIINADTDRTPYDTGTFASTGTVVAGQAVELTARALRVNILEYAAKHTGTDPPTGSWKRVMSSAAISASLCRTSTPPGMRRAIISRPSAKPISRRAPSPSMSRGYAWPCTA
jgi:Aerobic-type carbon monoxide dehydrogenase, large subunit CoxL/CutL homologs